jgi:hypothetical protein
LSIVNKSARITLKVAGKLKQFSVRIVSNGPEFESHFCLMRTTYWTALLAIDARSLAFNIFTFATKLEFSFFLAARYNWSTELKLTRKWMYF